MISTEELHALQSELNNTSDLWERLPKLILLSEFYGRIDPAQAHAPALEALHLAKSFGDDYWIAQSYYAIGQAMVGKDKFSETLFYLRQAAQLLKKFDDPLATAKTDHYISKVYLAMGQIEEALTIALRNQQYFEESANHYWLCRTLLTIGDCYSKIGDHVESLRQLKVGLNIATEHNFLYLRGRFHTQLGSLFCNVNDRESQKEHLLKGVAIFQSLNSKRALASVYSNLSTFYLRTKEYQEAKHHATQARDMFRELGFTARVAIEISKLAAAYGKLVDPTKCILLHLEAINLLETTENLRYLAYAYKNLAIEYYHTSQPKKALHYILKALPIAEEGGDTRLKYEVYQLLAAVYQGQGINDTANALKYYHLFIATKDEYAGAEKQRQLKQEDLQHTITTIKSKLNRLDKEFNKHKEAMAKKETELLSFMMQLPHREPHAMQHKRQNAANHKTRVDTSFEQTPLNTSKQSWFSRKELHSFFITLMKQYPQLTSAEVKVCSLIRLGLSSKEIADELCVSKRTIDNHREHIRKKLQLPPRSPLTKFILGITTT